jgi:hypothetical protein
MPKPKIQDALRGPVQMRASGIDVRQELALLGMGIGGAYVPFCFWATAGY